MQSYNSIFVVLYLKRNGKLTIDQKKDDRPKKDDTS